MVSDYASEMEVVNLGPEMHIALQYAAQGILNYCMLQLWPQADISRLYFLSYVLSQFQIFAHILAEWWLKVESQHSAVIVGRAYKNSARQTVLEKTKTQSYFLL